jgi:hypothetical protein
LEEAYAREQGLLGYLQNELSAIRAEVEDAKRELGANHIAFEPTVMRLESHGGRAQVLAIEQLRPFEDPNTWRNTSLSSLVLHTLELNANRRGQGAIHLDVQLGDGRVCYGISDLGLAQISDRGLYRHIAESLAQQLTVELRRLYPRRK